MNLRGLFDMHDVAGEVAAPLLIEVVDALTLEPDFEVFFAKAASAIRSLLEADGAALILLDDDGETLEYHLFEGEPAPVLNAFKGTRFPASAGVSGVALRERRSIYVPDYPTSAEAMPSFVRAGLKSNVVIPLVVGDQAVGVLAGSWLYRHRTEPAPTALALAERIATQIAIACQRDRLERRLRELAHTDPLTQLASRRGILEALDERLAQRDREPRDFAVLLVDLDGLKAANDRRGHEAGDNLLRDAGRRLREALRRGDRIGRLGGDEFLIVADCAAWEIPALAERLLQAVRIPFGWGRLRGRLTASIGVALCPADGTDPDSLLRRADTAMYHAKADGGDGFRRFVAGMESVAQQQALHVDVAEALSAGELQLWYQPLVQVATLESVAFEALLRWRQADGTVASAGAFIHAVEAAPGNLVYRLGSWVLLEAVRQLRQWQQQGLTVDLHVNVSPRHFLHPGFLRELREIVGDNRAVAERLVMEITESTVLDDLERASRVMQRCREMGIRIAIDDFGTGYASLTYLKALPLDVLKIDRTFVADLAGNELDQGIVRSVVDIAHARGLVVVAEGAEAPAQIQALQGLECDQLQGFVVSPAMPADGVDRWRAEWAAAGPDVPRLDGGSRPPAFCSGRGHAISDQ